VVILEQAQELSGIAQRASKFVSQLLSGYEASWPASSSRDSCQSSSSASRSPPPIGLGFGLDENLDALFDFNAFEMDGAPMPFLWGGERGHQEGMGGLDEGGMEM